jgi:hypothetical protein
MMTGHPYITGTLMITIQVVFHVSCLVLLTRLLNKLSKRIHLWYPFVKKLCLLSLSVFFVIAVHVAEIIAWALIYLRLNEFSELQEAVYFSTITATTLGYGDLTLSSAHHLLSGFEAIGGLILFGVSTAFFIKLIGELFNDEKTRLPE